MPENDYAVYRNFEDCTSQKILTNLNQGSRQGFGAKRRCSKHGIAKNFISNLQDTAVCQFQQDILLRNCDVN